MWSVNDFKNYRIFLIIFLLALVSCKSGEDQFAILDNPGQSNNDTTVEDVKITTFSPSSNPVRITSTSTTTFVVGVNNNSGTVTFTWKLDGSQLAQGTDPFMDLMGATVSAGAHTLQVVASNEKSEDSKTFVISKNTPPQIDSSSPTSSGNNISCGTGSLAMSATASDVDSDALSYTWQLNGATHASYFSITNGSGTSSNTFSPPCSVSGANTVTLVVSDGYDTTSTTWAVTVSNPTVAQIDSYVPSGSPIVIASTGSQLFSISASGKAPLTYQWKLDGTTIPGETNAFITITAASLSVGNHTLTAVVTDTDSNASHDFTVKRNAPPVLTNPSPSVSSTIKLNYTSLKTFSIDGSDANGDAITYSWYLDAAPSGNLAASATGSGHQAIYSPTATHVGTHTLMVSATDGVETAQQSWTVNVNYFSDACNNLTPGQICTIIGKPGYGNGLYPASQNASIKIRPTVVLDDGSGNLFIADDINHVVWFHNRSGSPITRLGKTIQAGQLLALVGNGAQGTGPAGNTNNTYKLRTPYGLAWDAARENLFVALYSDHRVVRVDSTGTVTHDICNGSGNDPANNGGLASTHKCQNPANLAYDPVRKYLYVTAYGGHQVKMFDLSDATPANWTGHYMVGTTSRTAGAGTTADDGAVGSAKGRNPYALTLDSNGVAYYTDYAGRCHLRAINNTGSNYSYMGGAVVVNSGQVKTITNGASCTSTNDTYANIRFYQPRGLSVLDNAGTVKGWFVTNRAHDRTTFLNNTAAAITIGGRSVPSYEGHYVWNSTTTAGYGGESGPAMNNATNEPWGIIVDNTGNNLIMADRLNFRIRALDISVADGALSTITGGGEKYGFNGGSNSPASTVKLNSTTKLLYDSANNSLIFADANNYRVRTVNLETGAENTLVGKGTNGAGNIEDEDPLNVNIQGSYGLAIHGNALIYADRNGGSGTYRNCLIRAFNRGGSNATFFNKSVVAGRVTTIAGSYAQGCGNFTEEGSQATLATLDQPEGVASDGTNLYVSLYNDHCIVKIASDGTISRFIGTCNTAGDVNGGATTAGVKLRYPSTLIMDPRNPTNLIIADQTDQATNKIKYANLTASGVTISGITIAAGQIGTIYSGGGYGYGVAAFDNQICYTSGHHANGWSGSHNVQCKDRDNPIPAITMLAGRPDGDATKAACQSTNEEEGVAATSSTLYTPYGLAFDSAGNLYISDRNNYVIRMVKRWW